MIPLTKTHFVSTIEAIRQQLCKDIAYADAVSSIYNTDSIGPYDNSLLVKQLISHLQLFFPKDEKGFCEIEHYCFDMNFGKIGDQELITAEDLWDRLCERVIALDNELKLWKFIREPLVSTHPLIDDNDHTQKNFLSDFILSENLPNSLGDPIHKQEKIFDIIERLKKEAVNQRESNKPYGTSYDERNRRYCAGKIHAFEAIENELKKK